MTFTIYIICYNISYMLLMCMPYWLIAVCCGRCQSWLTNCHHVDLDKFMCQGLNTPYEHWKLCSDHFQDSQFLNPCLHNGLVIDIVCCYCIWILWHSCKLTSKHTLLPRRCQWGYVLPGICLIVCLPVRNFV